MSAANGLKATYKEFEDISVREVSGSPQVIATTITLGSSCDFARHVGHAGRFYFLE